MIEQARAHFKKVDPLLYQAWEKIGLVEVPPYRHADDYFTALTQEIIFQQLSGKVARVIFGRFVALFPNEKVTPEFLVTLTHDQLRSAGLSNGKAKYVRDLAEKVLRREVILERIETKGDEEVIEELIKVKGIGRWTAEMFLMFTLARPDVFSPGDLALRNAVKKIYHIENPTPAQLAQISQKWFPYRTYASLVLWKSLE